MLAQGSEQSSYGEKEEREKEREKEREREREKREEWLMCEQPS